MGLISRVSSRTYRDESPYLGRTAANVSTFKNAAELWSSAAPPHPNKRARGKRTTVKRLVDFQQGHNIGEKEGTLIDGLHQIPKGVQVREKTKRGGASAS